MPYAARLTTRLRDHREHHLPIELDAALDENWVVVQHRADVVLARDVRWGQHRDDAGRSAHRIEIEAKQLPRCDGRAADRDVQQPFRLANVVDKGGAAGHMLRRGIMPQRPAHDAQAQFLRAAVKLKRHRPPPGIR